MSRMLTVVLLCALASGVCAAQTEGGTAGAKAGEADVSQRRAAVQKSRLESLLSPFGIGVGSLPARAQAASHRELRLRWDAKDGAQGAAQTADAQEAAAQAGALVLVERRAREGGLAVPRSLEMSPEQVLVVALDAASRLRWWTLIYDPRILRAESLTPDLQVRGQVFYRATADFSLAVPDDAAITQLRFFKPTPDGDALTLRPLAALSF